MHILCPSPSLVTVARKVFRLCYILMCIDKCLVQGRKYSDHEKEVMVRNSELSYLARSLQDKNKALEEEKKQFVRTSILCLI